jgi:hypothetical protein
MITFTLVRIVIAQTPSLDTDVLKNLKMVCSIGDTSFCPGQFVCDGIT